MPKFREKRPSLAIAPNDVATSTFNNLLRSDAKKSGLGRVILYSVPSRGRNTSPPSLGAQCGCSVRKRVETLKIALSNRRCGCARACIQEIYIFELNSARATSLPSLIAIGRLRKIPIFAAAIRSDKRSDSLSAVLRRSITSDRKYIVTSYPVWL